MPDVDQSVSSVPEIDANEELLKKFAGSRTELEKYIRDLDTMKQQVMTQMVPTISDYRSKFALEDKVKTVTSFFGVILSFRQEYTRNVKEEIELRRKLEKGEGGEAVIDIQDLADRLETEMSNRRKKESAT